MRAARSLRIAVRSWLTASAASGDGVGISRSLLQASRWRQRRLVGQALEKSLVSWMYALITAGIEQSFDVTGQARRKSDGRWLGSLQTHRGEDRNSRFGSLAYPQDPNSKKTLTCIRATHSSKFCEFLRPKTCDTGQNIVEDAKTTGEFPGKLGSSTRTLVTLYRPS